MKKENVIIFLLVFLPLFLLIVIVTTFILKQEPLNDRDFFLMSQKKQNFNSVIINIKDDRNNRNIETIYSRYNKIVLPRKWKNKVQIGDSVSKEEGKLFLKIYKEGKLFLKIYKEGKLKDSFKLQ